MTDGFLRSEAARAFLGGISKSQWHAYRRAGWIVPDAFLPSVTGGKPTPLFTPASLRQFLTDASSTTARKFTPSKRAA